MLFVGLWLHEAKWYELPNSERLPVRTPSHATHFSRTQTPPAAQSPRPANPRSESCGQHHDHLPVDEYLIRSHLKQVNPRRLFFCTIAGIAILVVLALATSAYWEHKQPRFDNAPKLFAALRAFSRDEAARGQLPSEVSLRDLLRGGYVSSNDVQGFEVTFSTHYGDAAPQLILVRALAPDGRSICLLADGSVQELSPQKYNDQSIGPRTAATNQAGMSRPRTR